MRSDKINNLITKLSSLSGELEWIEFKSNFSDPEEIGEYISALSNSAALFDQSKAYMVWGIQDKTLDVIGTNFQPRNQTAGNKKKNSNQELRHLKKDLAENI